MSVKATVAFLLVLFIFMPSALAGTVTRSFSPSSVSVGQDLTVNIAVDVVSGETNYAIDEIAPSSWLIHSYWSSQNYCDANICGDEDNDCGVTCMNLTCDTTDEVWCNSGTWTSTNYCTQCGGYDYDCRASVTCVNGACDIYRQYWCNQGTWTNTNYCDYCWKYDSDCCTLIGSICDRTCATDECDTDKQRWCYTETDGGDTHEDRHVKWAVISGATDVTYSYLLRAPSQTGTYTWSGEYMFEGMSSENDIPPPDQVSVTGGCTDNDGDTYSPDGGACGPVDCDDNPSACGAACYPGATEICDGYDNDCDTQTDEGCDDDNDDYCDENMVRASPYSCSGGDWCCPNGGNDCDDTVPSINPAAQEVCDGVDNDCNDRTDYFTSPGDMTQTCGPPNEVGACKFGTQICSGGQWGTCSGNVSASEEVCNLGTIRAQSKPDEEADDDCNGIIDDVSYCHCTGGVDPRSDELCPLNGIDDDCNGQMDEDPCDCEPDVDTHSCQDQYGVCAGSTVTCPAGGVWPSPYCNEAIYEDYNSSYEANSESTCDGYDNDCDGSVDEGLKTTFYRDSDGDGYGDPAVSVQACDQPSGYVMDDQDCDDDKTDDPPGCPGSMAGCDLSSSTCAICIHPGATEVCDGEDNNCDGELDPGCPGPIVITADYYDGRTTEFESVPDTTDISNMVLEKTSYGMIEFLQNINISYSITLNPPNTRIGQNLVSINSSRFPFLNRPAEIHLYNLTFLNPVILRNNQPCSSSICQIISYTGGNLTFEVTEFTNYSATGSCSDGTLYDECSSTKPRYCLNSTLVNRAGICGCPSGYEVDGNDCVEEGDGDGGGEDGGGGPVCTSGQQIACSVNGVCKPSYQTCINGFWGACEGPDPQPEVCDGIDNNCNGLIDDGITCLCEHGDTRVCGPSNETGLCQFGTSVCYLGAWGSCEGATYSSAEICDEKDNDCDGEVDEQCATNLCRDGAVPPEGCICDTEVKTSGYCCSGIFSEYPCPINLWSILLYSGLFILILLFLLFIYFRSKGKELTWEGLKEEYRFSKT